MRKSQRERDVCPTVRYAIIYEKYRSKYTYLIYIYVHVYIIHKYMYIIYDFQLKGMFLYLCRECIHFAQEFANIFARINYIYS